MQHVRPRPTPRTPTQRSRISNGTGLLAGVDGRSTGSRRYRDIVLGFVSEYGIRTDHDLALIETAASIKVAIENQTALMVAGDQRVDQSGIARLSTELRHVLGDLKRRSRQDDSCCDGAAPPTNGNAAYANLICEDEEQDD